MFWPALTLTLALLLPAGALAEPAPEPVYLPPVQPVSSAHLGTATPIENPPQVHALAPFYAALRDTARAYDDPATPTREDQTRIVVFGASHVAGDLFTSAIRDGLKRRYGDAGLGFLVPANPWRSYNNRDANLSFSTKGWDNYWFSGKHRRDDGRYGLGAITFVGSSRKAWAKVETAKSSAFGRDIDHVEVWYWRAAHGGDFIVEIDGRLAKRVKTKPNSKKNESEGFAVWQTNLKLGSHEVELRPAGNGEVTFFGVVLERRGPGIIMDTLGINGARATNHIDWDAGLFTAQLQRRDPDLVVLAYGTNAIGDSEPLDEYARKLDGVVNRVRSAVPQAACLYIGPSDRPIKQEVSEEEYAEIAQLAGLPLPIAASAKPKKRLVFQQRPRQEAVIAIQRETAWRYGCAYWNWAGAMGGDLSMLRWVHADEAMASPDYVHLNRRGYERIADLFWDALMVGVDGGAAPRVIQGPSLRQGPTLGPR